MDSICDLLYHIKYMFVGDMLKNETEVIIRKLRPKLQLRLRFISHLSVDKISASSGQKNVQTLKVIYFPDENNEACNAYMNNLVQKIWSLLKCPILHSVCSCEKAFPIFNNKTRNY